MENNENKKPQLIIIGAGPDGKIVNRHIELHIEKLKEKHEVIFVESIEKARELTGLELDLEKMPTLVVDDLKKDNPFENPPIPIKPYDLEAAKMPFIDFKEHNPWPSPKGRNGKRRW
jgi:hypothetical protein